MGESRVVAHDVLGERAEAFVEGALGRGIVLTDLRRGGGGGGEKGESVVTAGLVGGLGEIHGRRGVRFVG
jgi:hypothetical protein